MDWAVDELAAHGEAVSHPSTVPVRMGMQLAGCSEVACRGGAVLEGRGAVAVLSTDRLCYSLGHPRAWPGEWSDQA